MKTKDEILNMNKSELNDYKWSNDLNINNISYCSDCSNCSNCSYCSDCSNCSNCSYCRNLKTKEKHKYKICNIQFTKEEYDKKMKELNNDK